MAPCTLPPRTAIVTASLDAFDSIDSWKVLCPWCRFLKFRVPKAHYTATI